MSHLFVYGTLLQSENILGKYLSEHSTFVSAGRFSGRLYDAGNYPAALFDDQCGSFVFGSVLLLHNAANTLPKIDEYEGVGVQEKQPNEYVREWIAIETASKTISCWVYLYNLPVASLKLIESGNYIDYISI